LIKLKYLHFIIRSEDMTYLLSNRWERLIKEYLIHLEEFHLDYWISNDRDKEPPDYPWESNQFISSFWIERKWIFEVEIEIEEYCYVMMRIFIF